MRSPLKRLLPYQARWVHDNSRFKIACQARQTGKSFQTACEAVRGCFTDPGAKWVCLSSGERQSLEWIEKAKDWSREFAFSIEDYTEDRQFAEALLKVAEINFANGSRIVAIPANPLTARGYSANVILDEFAYHEDPRAIWSAMFPSVTNPMSGTFGRRAARARIMKICVVSTFNGRENKFFELWDKREKLGYSGHFTTIHDAALAAAKAGYHIDIEQLRVGLDDPDAWAQEYECQAADTSNILLPYELLSVAETVDASEAIEPEFFMAAGRRQLFCGIDFGRSNDPTVCWTLELMGDILWTREVVILKNMSTAQQNEILSLRIKAARRTCLDYTGPGIGFGDYAVKESGVGEWKPLEHRFGRIELFNFTPKSKRMLFPTLRRKFESPCRVRIPISREIREDLHAMQQVIRAGEYSYWAPRTKEGHSDRCTALALAIRAARDAEKGVIRDVSLIRFGRPAISRMPHFTPMRLTQ